MNNVKFSSIKMGKIIEKHFPTSSSKGVQQVANLVLVTGKTYITDTNVVAKVATFKGQTFVLLLKPADYASNKAAAITFYRDTSGSVAKRIARKQWKAA